MATCVALDLWGITVCQQWVLHVAFHIGSFVYAVLSFLPMPVILPVLFPSDTFFESHPSFLGMFMLHIPFYGPIFKVHGSCLQLAWLLQSSKAVIHVSLPHVAMLLRFALWSRDKADNLVWPPLL